MEQNTPYCIFMGEVYKYRDAIGENPFKNLAEIALLFLVFPVSDAEIERIFSQLNLVKHKTRNNLTSFVRDDE